MVMLWVVIGLTLVISASCSLFEAVLYSTRIAAVEVAKKRGGLWPKAARRVLKMKKNISEPIAAILILNTVAHTAGATLAGMYFVKAYGEKGVFLFSIALTLAILFLSEIFPKTVGSVYWRSLWMPTSIPIHGLKLVLYPGVVISEAFAKLFMGNHSHRTITEEELVALSRVGAEEGEISKEESRLVGNIIQLEEKFAKDILTPRTMIYSLDESMTVEAWRQGRLRKEFTRIPVYREHPETVVGYVHQADLHSMDPADKRTLGELKRPVDFFPENRNCLQLLIHFLKRRKHIAMVVDEYGGLAGLLTLEDLLETLLGTEIVDETDRTVDMRQVALKKEQLRMNEEVRKKEEIRKKQEVRKNKQVRKKKGEG